MERALTPDLKTQVQVQVSIVYENLIGPVPWQRSVFPMYFHIFHIFVIWYIFLCSKVFSKTCPRLLHSSVFDVCGFLFCSSVFKPIEANICLLLYNWAVNVNRVITNLAQNVFFPPPFCISGSTHRGTFWEEATYL